MRRAAKPGANPQKNPVSNASRSAKPTTVQLSVISFIRGMVSGRRFFPMASASAASPMPRRPPVTLMHQAFEDHLPKQRERGRAEGETHGGFALTANGTDQEKPGEVGAGDEQHDSNGEEEHAQQRTSLQHGDLLQRIDHGLDAEVRFIRRIVAHDLLRHAFGIALRLRRGDAGLEAANQIEIPAGIGLRGKLLRGKAHGNPEFAAVEPAGNRAGTRSSGA